MRFKRRSYEVEAFQFGSEPIPNAIEAPDKSVYIHTPTGKVRGA